MATDQPSTDHDPDTTCSIQFRPPFGEWGLVDIDGSEVRPNDADPECSIVGHVPEWDEYGGKHCVRCWENLSFVPRTPEQIERSRAIWAETTAALNRLLPEIKAASEKILADGQRLGNAIGRVIVDETRAWPPYIRRASGRITWARPIRSML